MKLASLMAPFSQDSPPRLAVLFSAALAVLLAGCPPTSVIIGEEHNSSAGDFGPVHDGGTSGGAAGGPDCTPQLEGVVRDFKAFGTEGGHPDFERFEGTGLSGIVEEMLGPDLKPVYAHEGPTEYTTGPEAFRQWYRDVPGVNLSTRYVIPLEISDQTFRILYEDEFFPIDDQLWGNQGRDHNYGFTFELHMMFEYRGGDEFMFGGDDDIWVFINRRLVLDIGGVHGSAVGVVDLDAIASEYGLVRGKKYPLDIFLAERRSGGSSMLITTLKYTNCEPIIR